jgi:hypothetical protein
MVGEQAPRSMVDRSFWTPPDRSTFNGGGGGGGSGIENKKGTYTNNSNVRVQIHDLDWILDPPDRSSFNGGGGLKCWLNIAHRPTVENKVHKSIAHGLFQTPPTDLSITEGEGLEWVVFWWAPYLYVAGIHWFCFPPPHMV